jgi:formylglycine-generating enzyme required for sulfatase activity
MYPATDTVHKVTSTLCYGVQWDAALNFIDTNYETGNVADDSYVKDNTGTGNYSSPLATTGSKIAYQQKHIYDMAGNIWEWTMEAYGTVYRVGRGGDIGGDAHINSVSSRYGRLPDVEWNVFGFRTALYL